MTDLAVVALLSLPLVVVFGILTYCAADVDSGVGPLLAIDGAGAGFAIALAVHPTWPTAAVFALVGMALVLGVRAAWRARPSTRPSEHGGRA